MFTADVDTAPVQRRGHGQTSHLLLTAGQFGARNLAITWVTGEPNSEQDVHAHADSEQAYIIVAGRGLMTVGHAKAILTAGTCAFVPPGQLHKIRCLGPDQLVYISATSPPFDPGSEWQYAKTEKDRNSEET